VTEPGDLCEAKHPEYPKTLAFCLRPRDHKADCHVGRLGEGTYRGVRIEWPVDGAAPLPFPARVAPEIQSYVPR
jgi:hypothetical protein